MFASNWCHLIDILLRNSNRIEVKTLLPPICLYRSEPLTPIGYANRESGMQGVGKAIYNWLCDSQPWANAKGQINIAHCARNLISSPVRAFVDTMRGGVQGSGTPLSSEIITFCRQNCQLQRIRIYPFRIRGHLYG